MVEPLVLALFIALHGSVQDKESLRFQYCLEQGYDTSCGMTVAGTMLDRYWDIPVTELELIETVLRDKLDSGDYTVSLADMSTAFSAYGLSSKAYKLDWDGLIQVIGKGFAPLIVHYEFPEKHFALLLGFRDGRAITVDPARGMESLSREQFLARYSGVAMAAGGKQKAVNEKTIAAAMDYAGGKRDRMEEAASRIGRRW